MSCAKTILLCGVGGQGTILAADLLARAALAAGFQVKVSEIHGMAQRGGAVTTVVRYGDDVNTMIADIGETDCIVSFETTALHEATRRTNSENGRCLGASTASSPGGSSRASWRHRRWGHRRVQCEAPVKSRTRSMMGSLTLPNQLTVCVARATQPSRKSVIAATV